MSADDSARPLYSVAVSPKEDCWQLVAVVPGDELVHKVRSIDDMSWVETETRTVVAGALDVGRDDFDLRFVINSDPPG